MDNLEKAVEEAAQWLDDLAQEGGWYAADASGHAERLRSALAAQREGRGDCDHGGRFRLTAKRGVYECAECGTHVQQSLPVPLVPQDATLTPGLVSDVGLAAPAKPPEPSKYPGVRVIGDCGSCVKSAVNHLFETWHAEHKQHGVERPPDAAGRAPAGEAGHCKGCPQFINISTTGSIKPAPCLGIGGKP